MAKRMEVKKTRRALCIFISVLFLWQWHRTSCEGFCHGFRQSKGKNSARNFADTPVMWDSVMRFAQASNRNDQLLKNYEHVIVTVEASSSASDESETEEAPKYADDVMPDVTGAVRLYATHTLCISCLACCCQFKRLLPNVKLEALAMPPPSAHVSKIWSRSPLMCGGRQEGGSALVKKYSLDLKLKKSKTPNNSEKR
eukprot:symbB.v1.2.036444.t1/scaffold5141.1/size55293/4